MQSQPGHSTQYFDQAPINLTPSELTSNAGSMSGTDRKAWARDDDGESRASVYTSYTATTDNGRMVRKERGRDFNMLSETYVLPTDLDEWNRLDTQHRAITIGLGGLYPAPEVVRAILAPEVGVKKRIVDLGCGTGIWSTEMAREFPHCEVLGIDLAPVPLPLESLPPNCRFEVDDISLGLPHLQGLFDVVFVRAIGLGLRDARKSMADIQTCAKPGGIVIVTEADYEVYSDWPMVYAPFWSSSSPTGSYTQRMFYDVRRSATLGGSDLKTVEKILDEGFWTPGTVLDPETCKTSSLFLPIGTWCQYGDDHVQKELVRYVGMLMRQNISEAAKSSQPILLKVGWSKETTDRWVAGTIDECQTGSARLGLRARMAWGRRRKAEDQPAPALPKIDGETEQVTKYPFYEVFDTQGQAFAAAEIRNRGKDIPAPPMASQSTE